MALPSRWSVEDKYDHLRADGLAVSHTSWGRDSVLYGYYGINGKFFDGTDGSEPYGPTLEGILYPCVVLGSIASIEGNFGKKKFKYEGIYYDQANKTFIDVKWLIEQKKIFEEKGLEKQLTESQDKLNSSQKGLEELRKQLTESQKIIQSKENEIEEKNKNVSEILDKLNNTQNELEVFKKQLTESQKIIQSKEDEVEEKNKNASETLNQLNNSQKELEELRKQLTESQKIIQSKENEVVEKNKNVSEILDKLNNSQNELEVFKKQLTESQNKENILKNHSAKLYDKKSDIDEKSERSTLQNRQAEFLKKKVKDLKENETTLQNELKKKEQVIKEAKEKGKESEKKLHEQIKALQIKLKKKEQEITVANEIRKESEKLHEQIKTLQIQIKEKEYELSKEKEICEKKLKEGKRSSEALEKLHKELTKILVAQAEYKKDIEALKEKLEDPNVEKSEILSKIDELEILFSGKIADAKSIEKRMDLVRKNPDDMADELRKILESIKPTKDGLSRENTLLEDIFNFYGYGRVENHKKLKNLSIKIGYIKANLFSCPKLKPHKEEIIRKTEEFCKLVPMRKEIIQKFTNKIEQLEMEKIKECKKTIELIEIKLRECEKLLNLSIEKVPKCHRSLLEKNNHTLTTNITLNKYLTKHEIEEIIQERKKISELEDELKEKKDELKKLEEKISEGTKDKRQNSLEI
ncbi:21300_t:CDS:2 [Dentiscutata erythropus]|uniref:21300_t:CDS:1 n=1 Tax=Dentiscutata erythropus TaxID=1348616 RepID=A0A9N9APA4_9GLOM|nr:21300_t:CDS:2 [Dentiscutata erythropus]